MVRLRAHRGCFDLSGECSEVVVADALMTLNAFRIVAARGVMVRVLGEIA